MSTEQQTQPQIEQVRDAIHAAARRVFSRAGVHAVTLADVATEAKFPLDTVRRYYADEDALLRGIIEQWMAQTAAPGGSSAPPARVVVPTDPRPAHPLDRDEDNGNPPALPAEADAKQRRGGVTVGDNRTVAADMGQLALLSIPPHIRRGGSIPLFEIVMSALRSLGANKMRSVLTMLGIIIGVGAVVGLLAIGNGVQSLITRQITSNGANLVTLQGSSASANGVQTGQRYQSITLEDAQALNAPGAVPDALAISPEVTRMAQVTAGSANANVTVNGVWPAYLTVRNATVQTGEFVNDAQVAGSENVIALGPSLTRTLFGTENPIGQSVRVGGAGFRVVGVMTSKSGGFNSPDAQAYVPITAALASLPGSDQPANTIRRGRSIGSVAIAATTEDTVQNVVDQATDVLNQRHGVGLGQRADFEATTQTQLLQTVQSTVLIIRSFLAVVAGISLLVGGIGIMNIMLVSVTERTREIGIRKAIGAREGTILTQFVVEAVLLSLIGAVIGVAFGLFVSFVASSVWQPSPVEPISVAIAVGVAVATGLFFGAYPAQRAAKLKPIEALRFE